ncbi:MAG: DUF1211 domain-containing protein [Burkholderiales bacterium]|nr:DUF1211 domain-containing protein [Burkholderiales bacterium]
MLNPLPLPKARLEALTDGIFAVAMTLLVLDLKLPEHVGSDPRQVFAALGALLRHVDDYVISFAVLCVFWLAHLRLLRRLRDVDATIGSLNLAFLLFTTFVPPLTAFIGDNPELPLAAMLYGANLLLLLTCEALMWRHSARHLFNESVLDAVAVWRVLRRRFLFAAAVIVVGIVAALVEIERNTAVGYASYVYLLLIGANIARRNPLQRRAKPLHDA